MATTNLPELPSSTDPPITLEGIEVEHRRWCMWMVYTLQRLCWRTHITVEELIGSKEENETRK